MCFKKQMNKALILQLLQFIGSRQIVIFCHLILMQEKEKHEEAIQELRQELEEANLALSEARSLLAATQRQEKSMRDRLEADIRELQLKIHKLEVKM